MNLWKRTKEGITNRTNVHLMLGPWHADAQTNMFFVVKKFIGKMTHGRGEQTSKIWNYQANNVIIFWQNLEKIANHFFQPIIHFARNKINSFCFGKQLSKKTGQYRANQLNTGKYRTIS